jgi:hypothetical protein
MSSEKNSEERMDCAEFRDVLHDLERPGTRGAAAFESAMTHAEGCGDCGVLLVEEESLGFGLCKLARETARMPGAARVEAALLKEFRQAKAEPVMMPARRKVQWQIAALGVAAAVLLVLGTMVYQRNLARSTHTSTTSAATNQAQPAEPSRIAVNNSSPAVIPASTTAHTTEVVAKQASAESGAQDTEYTTAYVRLPYADAPASLEGGSVVRVTLARSALESYGLPAEGLGTGDRVTADMLVSEDGTPQAIRLVAQED